MKESNVRISGDEKMQLMGNLATMLGAGIPILETVDSLLEESKGNQTKILTTLKNDLNEGNLIHTSFARFPKSFDKVTISLIKAAEKAGNLETVLRDIKENIRKDMEFSDKVKSAMMYPIFVLLIFVGVMVMMLVVVIPKIAQVFTRLKMDLPLATKVLIVASNALVKNPVTSLSVVGAIVAIFIALFYFKRQWLTNVIFSLPFVSGIVKQIDLARFSRSFSLLLDSGLPILVAIDLSKEVILKSDLKKLIAEAGEKVESGKQFSEGLKTKKKVMSGMVVKLIEVGERTGSLNESMKDISETLSYEVTKRLETATALLEPIMLVFVGLAVGAMMLSIIGPIYGLISSVGM